MVISLFKDAPYSGFFLAGKSLSGFDLIHRKLRGALMEFEGGLDRAFPLAEPLSVTIGVSRGGSAAVLTPAAEQSRGTAARKEHRVKARHRTAALTLRWKAHGAYRR